MRLPAWYTLYSRDSYNYNSQLIGTSTSRQCSEPWHHVPLTSNEGITFLWCTEERSRERDQHSQYNGCQLGLSELRDKLYSTNGVIEGGNMELDESCHKCNGNLQDANDYVVALNRSWHGGCFTWVGREYFFCFRILLWNEFIHNQTRRSTDVWNRKLFAAKSASHKSSTMLSQWMMVCGNKFLRQFYGIECSIWQSQESKANTSTVHF